MWLWFTCHPHLKRYWHFQGGYFSPWIFKWNQSHFISSLRSPDLCLWLAHLSLRSPRGVPKPRVSVQHPPVIPAVGCGALGAPVLGAPALTAAMQPRLGWQSKTEAHFPAEWLWLCSGQQLRVNGFVGLNGADLSWAGWDQHQARPMRLTQLPQLQAASGKQHTLLWAMAFGFLP